MSAGLIFKKIADVMADIEAVAKDKDNSAQRFKFRGIDQFYNMLHPKLAHHRIFSVPDVIDERREERPTKSGGVMTHVILRVKYSLFAEDGSSVSGIVVGEGSDTGDKAANKAMSIAHKYFLIQTFAVPTEDLEDPDSDSPEFTTNKNTVVSLASKDLLPGGAYVVKTKKYAERKITVAQLCAEIGQEEVKKYIDECFKWFEEHNREPSVEVSELYENAKQYFREIKKTPPPSNDWQNEEFPS